MKSLEELKGRSNGSWNFPAGVGVMLTINEQSQVGIFFSCGFARFVIGGRKEEFGMH